MICKPIPFPPTSVFPRTPKLSDYIEPVDVVDAFEEDADTALSRTGKTVSNKVGSLDFVVGPTGIRNIIKLTHSVYLDFRKYDWDNNIWIEGFRPVDLTVAGQIEIPTDHTKYSSSASPTFQDNVTDRLSRLEYYFNGDHIVTNFDFTDPITRELITVAYQRMTDTIKVKAILVSNSPGIVFSSPSIDQYTLVVGKQRMIK